MKPVEPKQTPPLPPKAKQVDRETPPMNVLVYVCVDCHVYYGSSNMGDLRSHTTQHRNPDGSKVERKRDLCPHCNKPRRVYVVTEYVPVDTL